jgi:hypothetical protein
MQHELNGRKLDDLYRIQEKRGGTRRVGHFHHVTV